MDVLVLSVLVGISYWSSLINGPALKLGKRRAGAIAESRLMGSSILKTCKFSEGCDPRDETLIHDLFLAFCRYFHWVERVW